MTGNDYQKLAMRTNDHKATHRLLDKADMIDFFKQAKAGRDTENYDLGGILNACLMMLIIFWFAKGKKDKPTIVGFGFMEIVYILSLICMWA